jgi:FAD/FMN-containing dehydrogenase
MLLMRLSVGIGGHILHGGYGLASHTYGLALDFMVEATAILADGGVVKASECPRACGRGY